MEKLKPQKAKEAPTQPRKTFAEGLREVVRGGLVKICHEAIVALYLKEHGENPDFSNDEEWEVDLTDRKYAFRFKMEVNDRYSDAPVVETCVADHVVASLDGSVCVMTSPDHSSYMEITEGADLSTDELFRLAETLEKMQELN